MHLYTNGVDTVVAESEQEANRVLEDFTGGLQDDGDTWKQIDDDEDISIYFEDELKDEYLPAGAFVQHVDGDDNQFGFEVKITAKAGAWAATKAEFLCSTEY